MRRRDDRHSRLAAQMIEPSKGGATRFLTDARVVLDWSPPTEETVAGRALVLTAANLIVRFAPGLRLEHRSSFADEVAELISGIDSSTAPFSPAGDTPISVRIGAGGVMRHVAGSADGWTAIVSGSGDDVPEIAESTNVFGALAAAAFVASEVFRHVLPVSEKYRWHAPLTAYSVFEYDRPSFVPPMLARPDLRTTPLLFGVGAIGQACIDALAWSEARGTIRCVDKGYVDDETNLNRSVLALEEDVDAHRPKVDLADRRLAGSELKLIPHCQEMSSVLAAIERGALPWPRVVASALDTSDDRRELQGVWPDALVDAATGDSTVQIFRHIAGSQLSCLRCVYHEVATGRSYEQSLAAKTGLSELEISAALADPQALVDDGILARVDPSVRDLAERHMGADVCGFLSAAEALSEENEEETALVSVSFSSYLAGVFLAAEIVKAELGIETRLPGIYQIDPLQNLLPDAPFTWNRRSSCYCVTRAGQIDLYRREMANRG